MRFTKIIALLGVWATFVGPIAAKGLTDSCSSVIIVGDSDWPPYFVQEPGEDISGVGVEIAKLIFQELDIPIVTSGYNDKRNMMQAFSFGDIDILVSNYPQEQLKDIGDVVNPAFTDDPITIAVRKDGKHNYRNWDDLIGQNGQTTRSFEYDEDTASYISRFLFVNKRGGLQDSLSSLQKGKTDYVIGSYNQLRYGILRYGLDSDVRIIKNINRGGGLHMSFAKNSACYTYAPYFKKRLRDMRADGTVKSLIDKYNAKAKSNPLKIHSANSKKTGKSNLSS